jgi:hypothetical protein
MKKRESKSRKPVTKDRQAAKTEEESPKKQAASQKAHAEKTRLRDHLNHGHYFLFFLLFLSLFTSYKLIQPYLNPIILAGILGNYVSPFYEKLV